MSNEGIFNNGIQMPVQLQKVNEPVNWQHYRIQAAIEFAAQILANHGGAPTSVAKDAVDYADALVEELKRSDYVYAECRRLAAINTASVCENMTKIQEELQKKQD
jgi:hypothetical protein